VVAVMPNAAMTSTASVMTFFKVSFQSYWIWRKPGPGLLPRRRLWAYLLPARTVRAAWTPRHGTLESSLAAIAVQGDVRGGGRFPQVPCLPAHRVPDGEAAVRHTSARQSQTPLVPVSFGRRSCIFATTSRL
jgi:hypothetical protein